MLSGKAARHQIGLNPKHASDDADVYNFRCLPCWAKISFSSTFHRRQTEVMSNGGCRKGNQITCNTYKHTYSWTNQSCVVILKNPDTPIYSKIFNTRPISVRFMVLAKTEVAPLLSSIKQSKEVRKERTERKSHSNEEIPNPYSKTILAILRRWCRCLLACR